MFSFAGQKRLFLFFVVCSLAGCAPQSDWNPGAASSISSESDSEFSEVPTLAQKAGGVRPTKPPKTTTSTTTTTTTTTLPSNPDFPISLECLDSRTDFAFKGYIEEVCQLVKMEREKVSLHSLQLDPLMNAVAQAHAEDMVNNNYFSHYSLDGRSPADRLRAAGVTFSTWGENIAWGYTSPTSVMSAWMNSSGHRANILNSGFRRIGIGYYRNYWVQVFAN